LNPLFDHVLSHVDFLLDLPSEFLKFSGRKLLNQPYRNGKTFIYSIACFKEKCLKKSFIIYSKK